MSDDVTNDESMNVFSTEESVISVSVGSEKLPNLTSDSQIQVGDFHVRMTALIVCLCVTASRRPDWFSNVSVSGPALGPAHLRHDRERVGANRGTHRGERKSLDRAQVFIPEVLIPSCFLFCFSFVKK